MKILPKPQNGSHPNKQSAAAVGTGSCGDDVSKSPVARRLAQKAYTISAAQATVSAKSATGLPKPLLNGRSQALKSTAAIVATETVNSAIQKSSFKVKALPHRSLVNARPNASMVVPRDDGRVKPTLTLQLIASKLRGRISGNRVLAPGPNHKPGDRSMSVWLARNASHGFMVHTFSSKDNWKTCKDHVRKRLGFPVFAQYGAIVETYGYRQADGTPYLRVQRTEDKQFPQSHWDGQKWVKGKPKGPKIPYRLPELCAAPKDTPVFIVEGEKHADRLGELGFVATTASEGAGKWTSDLNQHFIDRPVFILADNDEAGANHARIVANNLLGIAKEVRIVNLPDLRPAGDVSDWLESGGTPKQLRQICQNAPICEQATIGISAADLQSMTFEPVRYIVPGYVAEGVTLLAGKPKTKKSWMCLDWAIAVATGGETLGQVCEEADVLYLALEDTYRRIKYRMNKLLPNENWPERLRVETSMPRLKEGGVDKVRSFIKSARKPRLIIIDTLARVKSSKTSDQTAYEADYDAIKAIKALADEHGVAIVLVHHQRKTGADDPNDTVSGSTGLTGAVDTVLVLNQTSQGPILCARGRDIEEIETAMEFDHETCRWRVLGNATEVHRTDQRSKILDVLREADDAMSPAQISDATGMPPNNTRQLLYKMVQSGEVRKIGRGRYVAADLEGTHNNDNAVTTKS